VDGEAKASQALDKLRLSEHVALALAHLLEHCRRVVELPFQEASEELQDSCLSVLDLGLKCLELRGTYEVRSPEPIQVCEDTLHVTVEAAVRKNLVEPAQTHRFSVPEELDED